MSVIAVDLTITVRVSNILTQINQNDIILIECD